MNKKKLALISLMVLLVIALVGVPILTGCGEYPGEDEEPPEAIMIGAVRSLLGGLQSIGNYAFRPVLEYWAEEVNAEGGVYVAEYDTSLPVELDIWDDESRPDYCLQMRADMIASGDYDFVFGPVGTEAFCAAAFCTFNYSEDELRDDLLDIEEALEKKLVEMTEANEAKEALGEPLLDTGPVEKTLDLISTLLKEPDPLKLDVKSLEIIRDYIGLMGTVDPSGYAKKYVRIYEYYTTMIDLSIQGLQKIVDNWYKSKYVPCREAGNTHEQCWDHPLCISIQMAPDGEEVFRIWERRYVLEQIQQKIRESRYEYVEIAVSHNGAIAFSVHKEGADLVGVKRGDNVKEPYSISHLETEPSGREGWTTITGTAKLKDPEAEEGNTVVITVDPEGSTFVCVVDIVPPYAGPDPEEYLLLGAEGSCSSIMDELHNLPYVFAVLNSADHSQIDVLARMLEDRLGDTPRAYVVHSPDMHGDEYLAATQANFEIVGDVEVSCYGHENCYQNVIREAMEQPPYDVFCCFSERPGDAMGILVAAMSLDFNPPAIVLSWGANFQPFFDAFGGIAEGIIGLGAWNEKTSSAAEDFADAMIAMHGIEKMDWWGGLYYYAGLQCFQQAIEMAGTLDHSVIRHKLATEHFDTVLGETWFEDAYGNHPITVGGGVLADECHSGEIGQWQNGIFEVVGYDGIEDELPNCVVTADFMFPMTDQWYWLYD